MKYWSKGIKSVLYGVIKRQTERRVVCRLRGELIRLKWVDNEWRWDLVTVILDIDLWRDKGGAEKDKMRASSLTDCSVHFMFKIWFNSGSLGSLIASIHSSLIHSSRTLWPLWIRLSVYPSLLSFITVRSGPLSLSNHSFTSTLGKVPQTWACPFGLIFVTILTLGWRRVCGWPQSARPLINRETIADQYSYNAS